MCSLLPVYFGFFCLFFCFSSQEPLGIQRSCSMALVSVNQGRLRSRWLESEVRAQRKGGWSLEPKEQGAETWTELGGAPWKIWAPNVGGSWHLELWTVGALWVERRPDWMAQGLGGQDGLGWHPTYRLASGRSFLETPMQYPHQPIAPAKYLCLKPGSCKALPGKEAEACTCSHSDTGLQVP